MLKIEKNIYDKPEQSDGKRILVMRLWPRGISKDKIDVWMKELGTEKELIKKWKAGKIDWSHFAKENKKRIFPRFAARSVAELALTLGESNLVFPRPWKYKYPRYESVFRQSLDAHGSERSI
jgi:uncharacterized protein YeaO (DUF488 family)